MPDDVAPDDDLDLRALRAELQAHPAFAALKQWAIGQRTAYYENLGRQLYESPGTFADSDLDYKRGYWKGIARLLNQPFFDAEQLRADMARTEEEHDDLE
ncbi:MAG: hypothetical protein NUW01_15605 [Gemmatimonadaceae bacterium]|nr:hypothetical protein [Gemmatimonadaceae bacterium]